MGDASCLRQLWLPLRQRKSSFPETEEKVRRLKRKNAELAVIAKRLEERARKLQETNLRVVRRAGWQGRGEPALGKGILQVPGT